MVISSPRRFLEGGDALAPALPGARPGLVQGDPDEPGRQLRAALELIEMLESANPGILDDVLRFGRVVREDRAGRAVELLVVAAHQDLEEVGVAGAHAPDNFPIRGDAGFGSHLSYGVSKGPEVTGVSPSGGSRLYGREYP